MSLRLTPSKLAAVFTQSASLSLIFILSLTSCSELDKSAATNTSSTPLPSSITMVTPSPLPSAIINDSDCQTNCANVAVTECINNSTAFNRFDLHASIHTISIDGPLNSNAANKVYYRRVGATNWTAAQDLISNQQNNLQGVLFNLRANSRYEVLLEHGIQHSCQTVTTLDYASANTDGAQLHVDASYFGQSDGSAAMPYTTIQDAIDAAAELSTNHTISIVIKAGRYHESLHVTHNKDYRLQLIGEPGARLTGINNAISQPLSQAVNWQSDAQNLYYTDISGLSPYYVVRQQAAQMQRLYFYQSLELLKQGKGAKNTAIDEGFWYENGRLYVRSLSAPHLDQWFISDQKQGIFLDSARNVLIQGLEIDGFGNQQYATCIDSRDSSNIIIKDNHIHDCTALIWARKGGEHVQIQGNLLYQHNQTRWHWDALKATSHENSAIMIGSRSHIIIANNQIWGVFNGIAAGSWDDKNNINIAAHTDIFNNTLTDIGDDGIEPEGAMVNVRIWQNQLSNQHNGISLAPIQIGPAYIIGNTINEYSQSAIKFSINSLGPVRIFHNSAITTHNERNALSVSGSFGNTLLRNNSFSGTRYGFETNVPLLANVDFDYNHFYSTRGAPLFKWDGGGRFATSQELCAAHQQECHGLNELAKMNSDFTLQADSPLIDAGLYLPGINPHFEGEAPDIGAFEFAAD